MYHIIVNSINLAKRKEQQLDIVTKIFEKAGKEYKIYMTEYKGHAKDIAAEITKDGQFAHIVAMGGDGTLHEVLNGIRDVENCTLGLIPMGTGNDFATAAGIPLDTRTACENIVFRAPTHLDYIELDNGLRSINAVGIGMDVDVLKRAYKKKSTKKSKYFSAFLSSLFRYKAARFKVSWDGGEERQIKGLLVCLGNGTQIGGGIQLFPEAALNDGYMDIMFVEYLSRFRTVLAFIKLMTGKVNKVKRVTHVKCKSAAIIPVDALATIQAEGELYDGVELKAHVVTDKLKFYLPKQENSL